MIVALIQLGQFHTEIIGGLINALSRPHINIIVYTSKYSSSFVPYYKKIFNNNNIRWKYTNKYKNLKEKIEKDCDLYVFMTGHEYQILQTNPYKTFLITHITDNINYYNSFDTCGQIALSPVFKKEKIRYFLNIFEAPQYIKTTKQLEICIVGLTNPYNKDLDNFFLLLKYISQNNNKVKNRKILFNIINYYKLPKKFHIYEKSGLIKSYTDITASKTMKIIGKSDYVLVLARENSSYHTKQLSGIIPLAISVNTPLICDKKLAKIYSMSRISITYNFKDNYLLKAIQTASQKDKSKLLINIKKFRQKIMEKNKTFRFPCLKKIKNN